MEHQGPQTEFLLGDIGDIGTVQAAADADDAVVLAAPALRLDLVDDGRDFLETALIRVPVRLDTFVIIAAILAPTALVELERRIAGVHHAVGTDLILSAVHLISKRSSHLIARQARYQQLIW